MTAVLEVSIGLGFVYLAFSLITSTVVEWTSAVVDRRAKFLKLALYRTLGSDLSAELLRHPIISGIAAPQARSWRRSLPEPSYLPSKAVALALADIARQPATGLSCAQLARLMSALKSELPTGGGSQPLAIDGEVLFRLERWFAEQMDRTTAGYKRWTQLWTVSLALLVTIAFDLDTGRIAQQLTTNAAVRSALAATATNELSHQAAVDGGLSATSLVNLPVGWNRDPAMIMENGLASVLATLVGWAMSTVAIGLGAPFWFDLLNRLVSLRQTGPKPADSVIAG